MDISDQLWERIKDRLPKREGTGKTASGDNRQFINGVLWIMRTGSPWNQLPPEYGNWDTQYHKFLRWREAGIWEKLLDVFLDYPEMEWLMMDTSWCDAKQKGRKGGVWVFPNQQFVWPWMRMVCKTDAVLHKLPLMITRKIAGA